MQLPLLQLEQRVKQELEENPLLEEVQEGVLEEQELDELLPDEMMPEPNSLEIALHEATVSEAAPSPTEMPLVGNELTAATEKKTDEEKTEENDFDAELAEALSMDDDESFKEQLLRQTASDEHEYVQPAYEENLSERLLTQLHLLELSEKELRIAEEIIGNLDDDGYLRCAFEVIQDGLLASGIQATEKEIETVLERIWYLDPPGVGARNLQECLLIQLNALAKEDLDDEQEEARALAQKVLSQHYNEFVQKHYEKLLQDLACSPEELKRAIAFVQKLNPKPGGDAPSRLGHYVIPDFTITFNGQELVLTSNERTNLQIRLSQHYKRLIDDKTQPKETREFLREKLYAAKNFINAIQMRQHTMQKVMTALMKRQYDFFVHGESKLKPMTLKDLAEETGLDISTVSRVLRGKYVQTDFGIYALKYFFTTAVETGTGDEVSNRVIKQVIKELIEQEEADKPLSDDKLAELLNERGYKLARRTVTKYREQLRIPVARLRRKVESIREPSTNKTANSITHA